MSTREDDRVAIQRTLHRHDVVIEELLRAPVTCVATLQDYRAERDALARVLVAMEIGE